MKWSSCSCSCNDELCRYAPRRTVTLSTASRSQLPTSCWWQTTDFKLSFGDMLAVKRRQKSMHDNRGCVRMYHEFSTVHLLRIHLGGKLRYRSEHRQGKNGNRYDAAKHGVILELAKSWQGNAEAYTILGKRPIKMRPLASKQPFLIYCSDGKSSFFDRLSRLR